MHRSSGSRSPSAASLTSATARTLPVSTDWCARPDASAASAAAAPGSARPRAATEVRTAGACAASPAMNGSTCRRGSGTPASVSVSRTIARSVRPAIGAVVSSDRPNSCRNTTEYMSAPTPPAFSRVPSTSQSTRRSRAAPPDVSPTRHNRKSAGSWEAQPPIRRHRVRHPRPNQRAPPHGIDSPYARSDSPGRHRRGPRAVSHRRRGGGVPAAAPGGRRLAQGTVPVPRRENAVVQCDARERALLLLLLHRGRRRHQVRPGDRAPVVRGGDRAPGGARGRGAPLRAGRLRARPGDQPAPPADRCAPRCR